MDLSVFYRAFWVENAHNSLHQFVIDQVQVRSHRHDAHTWVCEMVGVVQATIAVNCWAWLFVVEQRKRFSSVTVHSDINVFMLSAVTAAIFSRKSKTSFSVARLLVASKSFSLFRAITMATLEGLNFDNRALRSLPVDTDEEIYSRSVAGKQEEPSWHCDVFLCIEPPLMSASRCVLLSC